MTEGKGLLDLAPGSTAGAPGHELVRPGRQAFDSSPAAVELPDGRILYNSWEAARDLNTEQSFDMQGVEPGDAIGRPSIRVFDPVRGDDRLWIDGAQSIAVSGSGRVAYARGAAPDHQASTPWPNEIVVHDSLEAEPEVWVSSTERTDEYTVLGWAGDALLISRAGPAGTAGVEVLSLDRPGPVRSLGSGLGFLAISPDGRSILAGGDDAWLQGKGWHLHLIDVATGARRDLGDPTEGVKLYGATWTEEGIVAAGASYVDGAAGQSRLVTLDTVLGQDGWTIELDRKIELDASRIMPATDAWLASDGTTVVTVGTPPLPRHEGELTPKPRVLVSCAAASGSCSYEALPVTSDEQVGRLSNPSRPSPEEARREAS